MYKVYVPEPREMYQCKLETFNNAIQSIIDVKNIMKYTTEEEKELEKALDVLMDRAKCLERLLINKNVEFREYDESTIDFYYAN